MARFKPAVTAITVPFECEWTIVPDGQNDGSIG